MSNSLRFRDAVQPLLHWLLGADRKMRDRVVAVGLCTVVYMLCCLAASFAVDVGVMQAWALPVLVFVTLPFNVLFVVLVRGGWTRRFNDVSLMLPQNILALCAIAFSYLALGPQDRGLVLVLLALVMVFGMYTHKPGQALAVGSIGIVVVFMIMVVLTQQNPELYPVEREIIRLELLLGCMPVLVYTAMWLVKWQNRLRLQRAELSKALATVQHLATRDTLTGLCNRRHMQDKLDEAVKRLERYGERFTVVLIDLDHFKRINDEHGHRVGDDVLASFAQSAAAVLRDSDTLARWGGEEFLMLLPDTTAERALQPLVRLQSNLLLKEVSMHEPQLRVKFSAGVATHFASATLDHTLERADAALYEAKHQGRNQIKLAPELPGLNQDLDAPQAAQDSPQSARTSAAARSPERTAPSI